jgi:DnaJ-domain-containing protein 1
MAIVFGGLAVTLGLVAVATGQLFVLLIVAPFAATAYFMWLQSTGRLRARLRDGARQQRFGEREATFGAGARRTGGASARAERAREREERGPFGPDGTAGGRRRRTRGREDRRRPPNADDGPTLAEAYDTLEVDRDADFSEVQSSYRELVKETHPDSGGDEERFKRVTAAYDTIRERAD